MVDRWRALIDTNAFISYLLSRVPETSAIGAILAAAAAGRFTLLFTPDVADEIRTTVAERPELSARIGTSDIDALLTTVDSLAESIPRIEDEVPRVGRDPKDDYLIAHAVVAAADYLVSWDYDLRDIGEIDGLKIVSPSKFPHALRDAGLAP